MSSDQQGLFSSVLGFLSREVQDFVTTATGGNTTERIVASTSSNLHSRTKSKRVARHSRRERLHASDEEGADEEKEWREQQHAFRRSARRVRPPRGTSYSPTPSPHRVTYQNPRRSTSPRRPKKTLPTKKAAATRRPRRSPSPPPPPPLDDRVSHDGHADDDTDAEAHTQKEDVEEEEPAPLPLLPRALRRRPSMTMPGALFPRSPSMDPEPAPVPKLPRNVHFPTRPTYIDYEVPMPGPSSSPEQVRHPSPSPVPVPVPSRSRAASVGEVTGRRSQEDSASSAWKEKGKQRAADVLLENGTSPSPAKSNLSGSGRDAEADVDTSGEIRVRGKEQELSAVRAERRAREKWWETEAETTMIREEKAGYEDKIKKLEEEVMRLQEELAKRPATNSADHSFSMPPPPPPPPPPPSRLPLVLPRIPTTPAAAELSFADIRAHLRHTTTPVEASKTAPHTARRVGKPTIGVPADKMAEFLKEMKTVRLRKVFNAPADMGREPPRANSAEMSFVAAGIQRPPRPADALANVGEKRKRDTQVVEDGPSIKRRLMGPLPRSADSSFRSSANSSFSSQSQPLSRSQTQSQPEAGPSKPTRSYIPVRAWPSSSVDGTDVTPSLTSDGDAEQGPDEPLPRTPPQVPTAVADEPEPEELEVEHHPSPSPPQPPTKKVTPVPRPPTPPRRNHAPSAQSLFDKRPPRSPLPAPSPQKARPPARHAPPRRKILLQSDNEEDDDPLAIVVLESPLARKERRPVAGPSRHTRKGSASSTQSGAQSKAARRRTLDEELRVSDGVTEDDLRALDIEPHTYTAVGPASGRTRKGFLAHGGGGGVPVFIGTDTVETGDDELEIIGAPSPRPPPRRKKVHTARR